MPWIQVKSNGKCCLINGAVILLPWVVLLQGVSKIGDIEFCIVFQRLQRLVRQQPLDVPEKVVSMCLSRSYCIRYTFLLSAATMLSNDLQAQP